MISTTTARLEARITPELHALLKRAAEIQGSTLSNFTITAVQEAAQRVIEKATIVQLSQKDQECFAQALLNPPAATPALKRAFARRQKLLEQQEPV